MKFIILGCGSSMGVPRSDGYFGECDPKNKKNYRTRCSAIIKTSFCNILIDTSPDLRAQLIKNNIKNIDKVLYSHMHADQTHGINDLRIFYLKKKKPIDIYADYATGKYLQKTFSYCFNSKSKEYPAILKMNKIKKNININGKGKIINIKSISVEHGNVKSICFIINNKLAYISDVSKIYKKDFKYFQNLKYLIIDCLWYRKHSSHFNLDQVLELVEILKPKKTVLTNLHIDLDYDILKSKLKKNIVPAFDGLTINL